VVGIPNERFGEEVVAAVELKPEVERDSVTADDIQAYVSQRLAAFKAPRRVRFVDSIGRSPSGKMDYGRHRDEATAWAAAGS
jgi:long-chain acyl-CoA synthetase